MRALSWIAALILLSTVSQSLARQIENWSYDRLFKEADLVVIASAKETIDSADEPRDESQKKYLAGQRTTFTVLHVLKGEFHTEPLTVLHFKLKEGVHRHGAPVLEFRTKGLKIDGSGSNKYQAYIAAPQYLLFLKRLADGRFEPISGQIDPQLSVKEMYAPLPAVLARAEQIESAKRLEHAGSLIVPATRVGPYVLGKSTLPEILGSDTPEARRRFADQGIFFEFQGGRDLTAITITSEQFVTKEGLKVGDSTDAVIKALGAARETKAKIANLIPGLLEYDGIQFIPKEGRVVGVRIYSKADAQTGAAIPINILIGKRLIEVEFALDDKAANDDFHTVATFWISEYAQGMMREVHGWAHQGGYTPDPHARQTAETCKQIIASLKQAKNLPDSPNRIITVRSMEGDQTTEKKFPIDQVPSAVREILLLTSGRSDQFDRLTFLGP